MECRRLDKWPTILANAAVLGGLVELRRIPARYGPIERRVFETIIRDVSTARGGTFSDVETIYGDMSRLVVAWLSETPPEAINELYNRLGWRGAANGRALHDAAQRWMMQYRQRSTEGSGGAPG